MFCYSNFTWHIYKFKINALSLRTIPYYLCLYLGINKIYNAAFENFVHLCSNFCVKIAIQIVNGVAINSK